MAQISEQENDLAGTLEINEQLKRLVGPNDVFNQIESALHKGLKKLRANFKMETYFEDDGSTIGLRTNDGSIYRLTSQETNAETSANRAIVNAILGWSGRAVRHQLQEAEFAPLFQRPSPPEKSVRTDTAA